MEQPRPKREVPGVLEGRWVGTSRALIRLDAGEVLEAVGTPELRNLGIAGDRVVVYYNDEGVVIGWMLVDANVGVNLELGAG